MDSHPTVDTVLAHPPEGTNWAQAWRLRFIDFRLRWDGRLNRRDLEVFFDISPQQASNDLAAYGAAGDHDNLRYEPRHKAFVAPPWFKPLFPSSASRYYLNELLSLHAGLHEAAGSFMNWRPAMASAPFLAGRMDGDHLAALLRAIRERRIVNARMVDVDRGAVDFQLISPHGLANDGRRWFVRAFKHSRKRFSDINLAWIEDLQVGEISKVDFAEDMLWHTELAVIVQPGAGLAPAQRRAVELDHGMTEGRLELGCRQSMLVRTLASLGVLEGDTLQLFLVNRAELEPYVAMARDAE